MKANVRNRLLLLGAAWGALLASVPAVVMADRMTGFLLASLLCAMASGCIGILAAGRQAARGEGKGLLAAVLTGAYGGLVGAGVAAGLVWALMAVSLSGLLARSGADPSALMRPQVLLGSFFVALSVFVYALAAGAIVSPASGTLVQKIVGRS